ncbi:MAG: DUF4139 domain-containing protein [Myxococcota bacterium]
MNAPLTVSSRIETVRVYARGATVLRELALEAKDGKLPPEIEISGLPLAMFDASVRLRSKRVEGAGEVQVREVRIGLGAPRLPPPEKTPDVARIEALERSIEERRDRISERQLEVSFIEGLPVLPRPAPQEGLPPPPSPMSARVALQAFITESTAKRRAEVRELERSVEDDLLVLDELRDQQRRSSNQGRVLADSLTKVVVARLAQNDRAITRVVLELEYFVPGARWAPAYQCRVARQGGSADLQMRALVCQRSGEDWRGVKLVLSTAMPVRYSELPELGEIRIGRAQPESRKRRGFRPPPAGAAELFRDFDRDRERAQGLVPSPAVWSPPGYMVDDLDRWNPHEFEGGSMTMGAPAPPPPEPMKPRPAPIAPSRMMAPPAPMAVAQLSRSESVMAMEMHEDAADEEAPYKEAEMERRRAPAKSKKLAMRGGKASYARAKADVAMDDDGGEDGSSLAPEAAVPLVYTELFLPAPTDSGRTRLRALDRRQAYLSSLAGRGLEVEGDAMGAIAAAVARSEASFSLPRDSIDVRSVAGYYDFVYAADAEVDVDSDGSFHSVALGTRNAKAELRYVVVPREEPHVYRIAHVTNPTEGPLLPGPVEVYVGGEFVLTTVLPTVAPRGEFTLGLGVEQAIKCARNTRFEEKRSGSKVVATNDLWHTIEIELANHLDKAAECEVRERIPQPDDEAEVVVEEGEVKPAWEHYTQEELGQPLRGGRRWRVVVPAGKSTKLEAKYAVKIYANNEIVGGNRRES